MSIVSGQDALKGRYGSVELVYDEDFRSDIVRASNQGRIRKYFRYDNIILSFQDVTIQKLTARHRPFSGLDNDIAVFRDGVFRKALLNTLVFTVCCPAAQFLIGFALAVFFNVNFALKSLGLIRENIEWLTTPGTAMFAIICANVWTGIPFSALILKNYFSAVPHELEEAAYIDGCSRFGAFVRVPILIAKPGVMVCAVFSFLYAWGGAGVRHDLYHRPAEAADRGGHL